MAPFLFVFLRYICLSRETVVMYFCPLCQVEGEIQNLPVIIILPNIYGKNALDWLKYYSLKKTNDIMNS